VSPRAGLNALKKMEDYFRYRESNHDNTVVQPVSWPLQWLPYHGSQYQLGNSDGAYTT